MRLSRNTFLGIAAGLLLSCVAPSARAAWVNGWWVYPYATYVSDTIARRPYYATDKGLALHDIRITNPPANHKGIALGATRLANGQVWAYRWVSVWHVEISGVHRANGGHVDFIQFTGGANVQDVPTTFILQDAYLHDGDGIPVMIEDGIWDNITLKDIRCANLTVGLQISTINTGHIGTITIDHCPNVSIAIMGRPGSIGTVYIRNSPGAHISDVLNKSGKSGCKIVYLN